KSIEIHRFVLSAGQSALDNDAAVCQPIARADSRSNSQKEQNESNRNRQEGDQIADPKNVNVGPGDGIENTKPPTKREFGDRRPNGHDRSFFDLGRNNARYRWCGPGSGRSGHASVSSRSCWAALTLSLFDFEPSGQSVTKTATAIQRGFGRAANGTS